MSFSGLGLYPSSDLYPSPTLYPGPVPSLVAEPIAPTPPDLLSDLPPYEQGSHDIRAVIAAVGNELGRIEAARQELIQNWFPASAMALLGLFESELRMPLDPSSLTLAQRQNAVLAYMRNLRSLGQGLQWEEQITMLLGPGWSYKEHDPSDITSPPAYTLNIMIPFIGPATVPTGLVATPDTLAGTLGADTYYYAVSSVTTYGQTLACTPVSAVLGANGEVGLAWDAEPSATTGYNVWRGTSSSDLFFLAQVVTNSFTDDGGVALSGQPIPSADTSESLLSGLAQRLVRRITPAHLQLNFGFSSGFLVGLSEIGVSPL